MIPSRPLSLTGILVESFSIYRYLFLRSLVAALLFVLPGALILSTGLASLTETMLTEARTGLHLTDADATNLRNEALLWLTASNPMLVPENPPSTAHPDTTSAQSAATHQPNGSVARRLMTYAQAHTEPLTAPLLHVAAGLILLGVGIYLFFASVIELASEVYEERDWDLGGALKQALTRNGWLLVFWYLTYVILSTVVSNAVGLLAGVSAGTGAFVGLVATALQLYVLMRSAVTYPAIVCEELGPVRGIRRSWQLTIMSSTRALLLAVLSVILLILFAVFLSIGTGAVLGDHLSFWEDVLTVPTVKLAWLAQGLPGFIYAMTADLGILFVVLGPLVPVIVTVFYYDLRTRREGPLAYVEEASAA